MDREELVELLADEIADGWDHYAMAEGVLNAIAAAGLAIVPEQPSEAMVQTGYMQIVDLCETFEADVTDVYRAMIATGKVK